MVDDKPMPVQLTILNGYPTTTRVPGQDNVSGKWEVWAEAYGASNALQQTYKSDDVNGRLKAYEAITKVNQFQTISESFPRSLSKNCNHLVLTCVLMKTIKKWNFVTFDEGKTRMMDSCG